MNQTMSAQGFELAGGCVPLVQSECKLLAAIAHNTLLSLYKTLSPEFSGALNPGSTGTFR